jgi:hypothetical protein
MSDKILQLAAVMAVPEKIPTDPGDELIEVSLPARSAGKLYEKARLAIDYQEEHLLRRNAILRIIKRYAGSDTTINEIAERLIRELIWAQYLPNREIPVSFISDLIPLFDKYEPLLREIDNLSEADKDYAFNWLLEAMATEIEYAISPPVHDEATVSFMYEEIKARIEWDDAYRLSSEQKDLFAYISVHQTLLKSDEATLRFRVLSIYYPEWPGDAPVLLINSIKDNLLQVLETIDQQIHNPLVDKLSVAIRRKCGLFRIIGEAVKEKPQDIPELLANPEKMDKHLVTVLKKRTQDFRQVLRRTVLRSIGFLFLTKMLMALIVEAPYEIIYLQHDSYIPLIVNIFFPPVMLALLALTVTIPEKQNAVDYMAATRAIIVGADHPLLNVRMKKRKTTTLDILFSFFYLITYVVVYGGIAIILYFLHFTWLSILLFLFFLSMVAFFGIRIRLSTKDIVLNEARRGLAGIIFDFFMIPVVRFGRWLSVKVSKVNVFVYFFDFILEAPIKVAIRVFESWTDFISEKREEL